LIVRLDSLVLSWAGTKGWPQWVERDDFAIESEPGISLFVREVQDTTRPGRVPVVLVHGARVPGLASFDLAVPGGSLAEDLALAGHRVFVIDARGYGRSTRPAEMNGDPMECRPLVRSSTVVRDIDGVVRAVGDRTGTAQVALLGWATGGMWVGHYATLYPHIASHLVLYNSLYGGTRGHPSLGPGSDFKDPTHPGRFNAKALGGYRLNSADGLLSSWDASIPTDRLEDWRDPAVAEAYVEAALASDDTAGSRTPPSCRAPTGALEDSFYLASGRQLWDASLISARTLIIRSERDFWSRPEDVELLCEHLTQAREVQSVALPQATHYVHLDRPAAGRTRFFEEVRTFLGNGSGSAIEVP
jgi:pimeloyl-ACP methyl ester carboxylesterase